MTIESRQSELTALRAFARHFTDTKQFADAVGPLQKCLELTYALHGRGTAQAIKAEEELGVTYFNAKMPRPAIPHLRAALEYHRLRASDDDESVFYVAKYLALVLVDAGLHQEALPMLESAIATSISLYGEEAGTTMLLRTSLTKCLKCLDKWQEMLAMGEPILQKIQNNPEVKLVFKIGIMRNVALAHFRLGHFDKALCLVYQTLQLVKQKTGIRKTDALDDLRMATRCLYKLKRYDDALAMQEQVLKLAIDVTSKSSGYCHMVNQELEALRKNIERQLKHIELMTAIQARKAAAAAS